MKDNWIYLIYDKRTGFCKIGRSIHPQKRLQQLLRQDTLLPEPHCFSLIQAWQCDAEREKEFHSIYQEYRVRGEWFALDLETAIAELRSICSFDAVQWTNGLTAYEEYDAASAAFNTQLVVAEIQETTLIH